MTHDEVKRALFFCSTCGYCDKCFMRDSAKTEDECKKNIMKEAWKDLIHMDKMWTSVKDALPKPGKRVLVYGKSRLGEGTLAAISSYNDNCHGVGLKDWNNSFYMEVTHWMELPDEPEVDE